MELWVRSQDRNNLKKVNNIYAEEITKDYDSWVGNIHSQPYVITSDNGNLGFYATKERALEILDEISNKIKNQYIIKANCLIKPSEMMKKKEYLENTYDGDFIMQPSAYEIEPINPHVIYFEMPSE